MLFNDRINAFLESDKERNLYFKVLGGCIFNELIPQNHLCEAFIKKLIRKYEWTCNYFKVKKESRVVHELEELIKDFKGNNLSVTFDFHLYRTMNVSDNGEMADILISGSNRFIAIETKYKTDYDYDKDLLANGNRILKASEEHNYFGIQVLLITKEKFLNSLNQRRGILETNYQKLFRYVNESINSKVPFILLLWEDVLEVISMDKRMNKVCSFLADMLHIDTDLGEFNTCPFAEEDWSLFRYDIDDNKSKQYSIVWCNRIGNQCDSVDSTLCGTRTWGQNN